MRFPSVSRIHFLECSGNTQNWKALKPEFTVQQTHGLVMCCEWTGVLLSTLLDEAGVRAQARWVLAEGADAAAMARSVPLAKAMDDAMIVYAQNGERLRPEQGYPVRLLLPGFEGNMNVKWLRRIKVGDQPWHTREETSKYTDLMPDGKARQFTFMMEAKSVITRPSGGQRLAGGPWVLRDKRPRLVRAREDNAGGGLHRCGPDVARRSASGARALKGADSLPRAVAMGWRPSNAPKPSDR